MVRALPHDDDCVRSCFRVGRSRRGMTESTLASRGTILDRYGPGVESKGRMAS